MMQLTVARVHAILEGWRHQAAWNVAALGDDFPDYYDPAVGAWARNGVWTEGFWTGVLWRLYAYARDERLLHWARHYTALLAERKAAFTDHDLGFLFYHSCVLQATLTGDESMAPAALAAAQRLAARFNPRGRFIRAHGALDDPERAGYAIIDTAMNLRLLFWAHRRAGDPALYEVARRTAETIRDAYVRPDGATYQVVWFDPATGEALRHDTLQGYAADSCWSRGQAWAIYGLAQSYTSTGDASFRDTALRVARYFMAHLPESGVAPYDFSDPRAAAAPVDTSAQAIAAAGLLCLAGQAAGAERRACLDDAVRLLSVLAESYTSPIDPTRPEARGMLRGGCYFLARGRGVDSELMFGDYYYLEALLRYLSLLAWE